MTRRGRFLLVALSALMFATVGATGAVAGRPLPSSGVAATAPSAAPVDPAAQATPSVSVEGASMALAGGRGCQAAISSPLPLSILASLDRPTEPGAADASGTTAGACSQTDPHLAPVEIAQAETHSPATPAATAGLSASARARAAAARIRAEAPRKPASSTGPAASPANPAIAVNIKGTVTGTSSVPLVGIEVDVMSASFGYVT